MDLLIASSVALMITYIYSKNRVVGFLAWITFAIACISRIPYFLSLKDYYNIAVFSLASVFFAIISYSILKKNSNTFVEVTSFSALACLVYFPFAFIEPLKAGIIGITANLTAKLGSLIGFAMRVEDSIIVMNGSNIKIILACTAIESISLFSGATLGINADLNRRIKAFLVSVPVIYVLNLIRNVFVIVATAYSLFGSNSFYIAHNIIAKVFSTIALIIIAYEVFKILPELADLIYSLKREIIECLKS